MNAAQTALDSENDKSKLETLSRELAEKLQKFQINTQPQPEQGEPEGATADAGSADDDVIDADFKPAG